MSVKGQGGLLQRIEKDGRKFMVAIPFTITNSPRQDENKKQKPIPKNSNEKVIENFTKSQTTSNFSNMNRPAFQNYLKRNK